MENRLQLSRNRRVLSANYCFYAAGALHPDRILPYHDFVYILEGEWEICQNGQPYLLKPRDVLLLHAGEHHYGNEPCRPMTKTMYLHATACPGDRFMPAESETPSDCLDIPTVIRNCGFGYIFQEIISLGHMDPPTREQREGALLDLLLCEMHDSAATGGAAELAQDAIAEVVHFIESVPERFLSAKELSERAALSYKALNRQFKLRFGKTVYRYQIECKLDMVCRYLTDYPYVKLRTVAENFGFYDEFHMSRMFKQKIGVSPREYRSRAAAESRSGITPRGR